MPAVKLKKPRYTGMVYLCFEQCPKCGTRMATDGMLKWCSYVRCDYVVMATKGGNNGQR